MKRVRVHNKVLFFSWFDFSEMAIAIPCGIILARLLTLSLCTFYWGGEMLLIYVLQLLNNLYEVSNTSIQTIKQYIISEFSIVHCKFRTCPPWRIVHYPTGFT